MLWIDQVGTGKCNEKGLEIYFFFKLSQFPDLRISRSLNFFKSGFI